MLRRRKAIEDPARNGRVGKREFGAGQI